MIVSSSWERDKVPQIDGRFRITETHVDHLGREHTNNGLFPKDYDFAPELSLRAQIIDDTLRANEVSDLIESLTRSIQPAPVRLEEKDIPPDVAKSLKYASEKDLTDTVAAVAAAVLDG